MQNILIKHADISACLEGWVDYG